MKATRNIILGVLLGGVIGWMLGFLRLPYIEKNSSFIMGFISCLAFVALVFSLLSSWRKNTQLVQLPRMDSRVRNSGDAFRNYKIIWILIPAVILMGVLMGSYSIYRQNENLEIKNQKQNKKIREQSELIESSHRSSMQILLHDVLKKVDDALKINSAGKLSDETIASIVNAFNFTFIPRRHFEGDSLLAKKLSPEKGQLLIELCKRNIDSISFKKIKLNAHFSGADLRKGDLHGVDLSGADFKDADLSFADLRNTNFQGADLRNANLLGAHADQSNFIKADMRRAILCWAEMNEANLDSANLNGTDLTNAQLRNADLHKATFRSAKLDGTLLNEANMEGITLIDASLKKTNLTKVNLKNADVNRANFNESIMTEAELTQLLNIDKGWFEKLNEWHVTGAKEILEKYKIVVYSVIEEVSWYRLEKK